MRYVTMSGEESNLDGEVLGHFKTDEDVSVVYRRNPADIRGLIGALKEAGVTESHLLTEEYWMTTNCTKTDGRCQGGCAEGACQTCDTGHGSYCCCR